VPMRVLSLILFMSACSATPAPCPRCPQVATVHEEAKPPPATGIEGTWRGVLGGKLHVAVTITRHDGKYFAILDSIDQGAKLPIDSLSFESNKLTFDISLVSGSYEGKLEGSDIKGTWTQYGMPQPLLLTKGEPAAETTKVEPPKKPLDAPIDIGIPQPPMPLRADDHTHLVYELHVTNLSAGVISLKSVDVSAGGHSLAHLEGADLSHALGHPGVGGTVPESERLRLNGGMRAVVYMWVTLDSAASPAALDHRIVVQVGPDELTVPDVRITVRDRPAPVIAAPLRGKSWLAVNGPSNGSRHRRALAPIAGHVHISQRFAIDWVKTGTDGKSFTGDPLSNASYLAYGADALAVADGVVTETKDGIPENVPQAEPAVPITLETIGGNHVIVDIGGGNFAFWAHLQPGSLKVKVGDHVKRGQVIGKVGNSGNSTEPHLHFHVTDGSSPLGSEGVPYVFESFEVQKDANAVKRTKQLPTERETIAFP
jgi:hypothetical protein